MPVAFQAHSGPRIGLDDLDVVAFMSGMDTSVRPFMARVAVDFFGCLAECGNPLFVFSSRRRPARMTSLVEP